ncbi:hypothetical protein AFE02nite_23400 [Actinotalea fermentans]|uniref:Uncharacterized protein n=1 Tax=Actinotalea fermentans TaxID=43671 RepID=A0A511YZQ9_9CELL|nr:hypothetical protein AFE02nite_23400 [Actinotalea fermentans]
MLLDGDDLPELMIRIREEMGPAARVVKAERIRTGGFAGFFAREHYELTVEVPDAPTAQERWRATHGGGGLDALMAAADAADDAVESVDLEPEAPPVSTAGPEFAEVLASVRAMVGQGETAGVAVSPVAGSGVGGEAGAPPAPPTPAMPEPNPDEAPGPAASAGPVPFVFPRLHGEADIEEGPEPTPAVSEERQEERAGATAAGLLELGVPVRLLEGFASLTDPVPLSMLVRRFDRPPAVRLEPGATVVVAGAGEHALRTASQMAGRAGLDERDVLLAGEIDSVAGHGRRLLTVAAAARHRSRRRTDVPTVVALGIGAGAAAHAEAATLLAALAPDQAWVVLDARLRVGEMRRLVRAVGAQRPVDALAVVGTQEAQAPGVVLDVGVPVGWVDGLPATALVWAALLSERLADDADWD